MARNRGVRRRRIVGVLLAVVGVLAAIPFVTSAGASPAPSSDINDYALYAVTTIKLKGGGQAGLSVIDGNIGAGSQAYQAPDGNTYNAWNGFPFLKNTNAGPIGAATPGNAYVTLCNGSGNNAHLTLTAGSYVASPSVFIDYQGSPLAASDPCQVPKVYTLGPNTWLNPPIPSNVAQFSFTQPNIVMPSLPPATCDPTNNATNYKGASLSPGTYGNWDFAGTANTTLTAGTYNFCSLTLERGAVVNTDPNTIINVVGKVYVIGSTLGACGTQVNVGGDLDLGRLSTISGTFLAPNDDVTLGQTTSITGHVWALAMHSDTGVSVGKCTPPPTTTTGTNAQTSTSTSTSTTTTSTSTSTSTTSTSTSTSTSTTAPTSTTTTTEQTTFTF